MITSVLIECHMEPIEPIAPKAVPPTVKLNDKPNVLGANRTPANTVTLPMIPIEMPAAFAIELFKCT